MSITDTSPTLKRYKDTVIECLKLYYPMASTEDLSVAVDYSIQKRLKDTNVQISNSYKRKRVLERDPVTGEEKLVFKNTVQNITLQKLTDYILSREPIVTAFGTMFQHHGTIPNPLMEVVQSFLDNRTVYKKKMLSFPKGSEDYEKYNLLQSLTDYSGTPNGDIGAQTALTAGNSLELIVP